MCVLASTKQIYPHRFGRWKEVVSTPLLLAVRHSPAGIGFSVSSANRGNSECSLPSWLTAPFCWHGSPLSSSSPGASDHGGSFQIMAEKAANLASLGVIFGNSVRNLLL